MAINLQFAESDWERIARDWTAWWVGELDRPIVVLEILDPPPGVTFPPGIALPYFSDFDDHPLQFPFDMPADQVLDHYQFRLEATRYYGDAWPKWWPNFGPGIVAGFLGAQVRYSPDTYTVWFEPAEQAGIGDLHLAYDSDNVWWRRVQELTRAAVERWGDHVSVAFTDLGGNLDILASLRGTQELLLDLYDNPDEVLRLTGEITRLWLCYYDELYAIIQLAGRGLTPWAAIWAPERCYMLQSDHAAMISARMFERFVLPDIAACCDALDHAFYHLDSKVQIRHLDMLLSLRRLRGIQWVPGAGAPPPEEWLPLLKRIRDAGKLCQLYISPEGARTVMRELGGRGFAFYLMQSMSLDEAEDFMRALNAKDTCV